MLTEISGAVFQRRRGDGGDIETVDVGTNGPGKFDYPVSGFKVTGPESEGEVDGGVLICGTGAGISLAADKVPGIRACVCGDSYAAGLSGQHNNADIIAFGARVILRYRRKSADRGGSREVLRSPGTDLVVAKSVRLRFRLRRKLRSLPCSSSPYTGTPVRGPL